MRREILGRVKTFQWINRSVHTSHSLAKFILPNSHAVVELEMLERDNNETALNRVLWAYGSRHGAVQGMVIFRFVSWFSPTADNAGCWATID
jgi:hypothetical protein